MSLRSSRWALLVTAASLAACAPATTGSRMGAPSPDPRVGLKPGMNDAQEALWNMKKLSTTLPSEKFKGVTNSDLAFTGPYAIQGNYNGWQIWDITNPSAPTLKTAYYCPASQSDVSVYKNLLFISGEGTSGRIDCGGQGVREAVSKDRLRGLRIFDITDIANPKNIANVQTCRGSHTHTLLVDPKDKDNVYIYISGSAGVRSEQELPGCSNATPDKDENSALFRIEVIKVPLSNPAAAAIVSSPRIFNDLVAPPQHGLAPDDIKAAEAAAAARAASGAAAPAARPARPRGGPTQCHDITVYPGIGLAGGACEGYGLLIDIKDPANPKRIAAVADSNFSYWHSATFNNTGSKVLFSDEWGGGGAPKCRASDPKEWGADALFTIENGKMVFQSYYKMPAPQTSFENCVAHNGSLIPVPGRDIMVQSWYQGGISIFDWTDIKHPVEIGFHDRGPSDGTRQGPGGTWSVYWYNGVIVSSEIARGLDIFELTPSAHLSQNEIDAAKTVKFEYLNTQGQPKISWPPSFALARAYVDQLERSKGLSSRRVAAVRSALSSAESASGAARKTALTTLGSSLQGDAAGAGAAKVTLLAQAVNDLANATR